MEVTVSTNNMNNYTISELHYLRESVEHMNKFNQVEVLRILTSHNEVVNENKYGIHINLSELKKEVLDEIMAYITYVNTQETMLHLDEQQKDAYRNTFFAKDIKDIVKT